MCDTQYNEIQSMFLCLETPGWKHTMSTCIDTFSVFWKSYTTEHGLYNKNCIIQYKHPVIFKPRADKLVSGKWYAVSYKQEVESGKYLKSLYLDGLKITCTGSEENGDPKVYEKVRVFLGDNFFEPATHVAVRNLELYTCKDCGEFLTSTFNI